MPTYEYVCPAKHVTTRTVTLSKAPGPKYIKCRTHKGSTHSPGCSEWHECGRRATRKTVYTFGVTGDLPTRGAF